MARLPIPGQDEGTWGEVLNDYLTQSHTTDGKLKANTVDTAVLSTAAVTSSKIADGAIGSTQLDAATNTTLASASGKYTKPASGIPASDLSSGVQSSLTKADTALQSAPVTSVAGKTGDVSLVASDVGAVATTRTINNKPLSTDITLTKADVGLSNVDNTADTAKPISTATQTALDAKANTVHTHAIADVTNLQTALDAKANAANVGVKVLLIDNAAALPAGTPAGVVVVVKS